MKSYFFNKHLNDSREGYFDHLFFSLIICAWIFITFFALIVHAILPFLFVSISVSPIHIPDNNSQ